MNCDWGKIRHASQSHASNKELRPDYVVSSESLDVKDGAMSKADASLLQKVIRTKLITTCNEVDVVRTNPCSPLFSVKSFEDLNLKPGLLYGVYNMGFNAPSKIQEVVLPIALADPPQNIIAQSQSGTGKTAAFILAVLSRVDHNLNYPQVLIMSPTYELAVQTGEVATKMAIYCEDVRMRFAVRGENLEKGTRLTDHIILGTPGKVLDWSIKYKFFDLSKIKVFVLDEADVQIDIQGHRDQTLRIRRHLSDKCQMMLFSATYDDEVMSFAHAIIPGHVAVIRLRREEETLDHIKQFFTICKNINEKYSAICNIYGGVTIGQAIIFCESRKISKWLARKLVNDGHAVALLTGEFTVEQRIAVLDRFREGMEKVIVTTNVLARGIDIEQVTIVVNFDLPVDLYGRPDCETYLHRIGRTGRFGKPGIAVNLVSTVEYATILLNIQKHFGRKIEPLDTDDAEEVAKLNEE